MTVVVTGAAGFVGSHLVERLLKDGRQVRALIVDDSERERLAGLDVEIVQGDVRSADDMRRLAQGAKAVYHLAAYISIRMSDGPKVYDINVNGTRNVVNACLEAGVRRMVHCSSFHALEQRPLDKPLDEDRPLLTAKWKPPYGRSKAAGEMEVRNGIARGLDAVIVNPTGIVGPGDRGPSYFGQVLIDLTRGGLPFLVQGGCNWVDVRDVVNGLALAEQKAPAGSKYLLSGHYATLRTIADLIESLTGARAPRGVCPMWLAHTAAPFNQLLSRAFGVGHPHFTNAALHDLSDNPNVSHARASRELGYEPRPFRETVLDTIRWFAEHGFIRATTAQRQMV